MKQLAFKMAWAGQPQTTEISERLKALREGDEGLYLLDLGFRIMKLPAKILRIRGRHVQARIVRGNGTTELKTISPKNFERL